MIYSRDIEKICGLCKNAKVSDADNVECPLKNKSLPKAQEACKKFSYDIQKRTVRRRRRINTEFSAEDFTL